jgi:hypothetical protein
MKTVLSLTIVFALAGIAAAADPVGTWKIEYKIGDAKRTADLNVTKDGDKHAGTMSWPDQKDAKLKDVKFKDGELSFTAERKLGDMAMTVEYKLKIDGDTLSGKGTVDANGKKTDFDITGKREKKDK